MLSIMININVTNQAGVVNSNVSLDCQGCARLAKILLSLSYIHSYHYTLGYPYLVKYFD